MFKIINGILSWIETQRVILVLFYFFVSIFILIIQPFLSILLVTHYLHRLYVIVSRQIKVIEKAHMLRSQIKIMTKMIIRTRLCYNTENSLMMKCYCLINLPDLFTNMKFINIVMIADKEEDTYYIIWLNRMARSSEMRSKNTSIVNMILWIWA